MTIVQRFDAGVKLFEMLDSGFLRAYHYTSGAAPPVGSVMKTRFRHPDSGRPIGFQVLGWWLALLLTASTSVRAQLGPEAGDDPPDPPEQSYSGFAYGLMLTYDQARDDLLAPIRWGGPGGVLRFAWAHAGPDDRHDVELQLPITYYQNRFSHEGAAIGLEAGYAYVHAVGSPGPRGSVLVGGHFRWDLYSGFYFSWDDEHVFWLNSYAVGPRAVWDRIGRRVQLTARGDLSLLGLVSRPPPYPTRKLDPMTRLSFYFKEPNQHLTLRGIPDFVAFHGRLDLRKPDPRSRFVLSYDLDVISYALPARVITLSHRIGITHEIGGRR